MTATRKHRKLSRAAEAVAFWEHSIDLGDGVVSDGRRTAEQLAREWTELQLPDLRDKTVLDVGAWDGYFSFRAEEAGAARVVALDHYVWSIDLPRQQEYVRSCALNGSPPRPFHTVEELWDPETLPGKVGFDTAHRARESRVESLVGDFMAMDLERLGMFDVVLFLGVLAHMRHPLVALERLARVTRQLLVLRTEAVAIPGFEHHGFCEFFEGSELDGDASNWWIPNRQAVVGLCRAAGFASVEAPDDGLGRPTSRDALHRYPLVVRAWRHPGGAGVGEAGPALPPLRG